MADTIPYEAIDAATQISEIFRLGDKLRARQEESAAYGKALAAFDRALNETTRYMGTLRDTPEAYNKSKEWELAGLWSDASSAISAFDPKLSNACFIKGQGWLDPDVWDNPAFKHVKVGLNDMRKARLEFGDRSDALTKPDVPPWVPIAGVVFAGLTFASLFYLVVARESSISRSEAFDVWVAFCVATSAAFLGGNAAASGDLKLPIFRKSPISFSAVGGLGAFVLVLILMNVFNPPSPATDPRAPERAALQGMMDYLCGRGVLKNPYDWEIPSNVRESISDIDNELTQVLAKLNTDSDARHPVQTMRAAAHAMLQNPIAIPEDLGARPTDDERNPQLAKTIKAFREVFATNTPLIVKAYDLRGNCDFSAE